MQKVAIILETDKNNKLALYYGTINELSLKNYPKSLKFSSKLFFVIVVCTSLFLDFVSMYFHDDEEDSFILSICLFNCLILSDF